MMNATVVFNLGQTILDSYKESPKKAPKIKLEAKDPEENQIVEGFDGECEKCEPVKPQKACSICGE